MKPTAVREKHVAKAVLKAALPAGTGIPYVERPSTEQNSSSELTCQERPLNSTPQFATRCRADQNDAIIRCLNDLSAAGASLQEVAERLQITKSHCHNILKTLTREGWLAYDDKRRSYSLAARLLTDISCLIRARRDRTF
jgi:hypothetical protein